MANFRVGQKVVCVDDQFYHVPAYGLIAGNIYTISRISSDPDNWFNTARSSQALWLDGVVRTHPITFASWPVGSLRFRPVAEKPTSMEIIKAIVLDPSKPIPADPRGPKLPAPVPEYVQGDRL